MVLTTAISAGSPGLAIVTIDHPPTNLVDGGFIGALIELLGRVEPDPEVRVLLFRSADPDFFLMHGDVEAILQMPTGQYAPQTEPNVAAATFERLTSGRLLTIGLLDGAARGGGCEFASALDLRLGSPRAVIGQPEVPMGILPGAGGTSRWPRIVGRGRALEILLSGRDVDAQEALEIGWLDRLVPAADLETQGLKLAEHIAAMPPDSIAAVKRVVDISLGSLQPALVAESDAFAELTSKGHHQAPMRAFLAAGGQTREGETQHMNALLAAMTAQQKERN
jgi:enoyl-CoA hydratase/carnithine racemase